jgi:hypothetical protein
MSAARRFIATIDLRNQPIEKARLMPGFFFSKRLFLALLGKLAEQAGHLVFDAFGSGRLFGLLRWRR